MSTAPEEQQLLLTPVLMLFPCNFRATFEFWHTRRILPSQCSFFSMRWHNSRPSPLQVLWCHFGFLGLFMTLKPPNPPRWSQHLLCLLQQHPKRTMFKAPAASCVHTYIYTQGLLTVNCLHSLAQDECVSMVAVLSAWNSSYQISSQKVKSVVWSLYMMDQGLLLSKMGFFAICSAVISPKCCFEDFNISSMTCTHWYELL